MASTAPAVHEAPTHWDAATTGPGAPHRGPSMRYLEVSSLQERNQGHALRVRYKGPGSDDRDAAAIRANAPVPPNVPVFYFEVEIANKGRDGFIGIGFSVQEVKLDRLPGWEPHSYGYHGDDGHVFSGRGSGRAYGPIFGTGDWIGVIYNLVEKTISFTKKGFDLGVAFQNVVEDKLYPSVGFRTPDEEIVANFGQDLEAHPFRGDYAGILRDAQQRLYRRILHTAVPRATKTQDPVGELVFGYLKHHGHWDTASAVARDALGGAVEVTEAERDEAAAQKGLWEAVAAGNIDAAAAAAAELAPGVLQAHPRVAFALQCQKFCELIKGGQDEAAMAYGREALVPAATDPSDQALLHEALTLFAYPDPAASPAGHLLSAGHRARLGAELQRAVRAHLGRREMSALDEVYRQTKAVHAELAAAGAPAAALIDVDAFVDSPPDD